MYKFWSVVIVTVFWTSKSIEVPIKAEFQALSADHEPSPGKKDYFGKTVKADKDGIFVLAADAVYIYERTNYTVKTLNQVQKISYSGYNFGRGLAIENRYLFAQVTIWNPEKKGYLEGRCLVYTLNDSVWESYSVLTARPKSFDNDLYGDTLMVHNGTLVLTSPSRYRPQQPANTGIAYVYKIGTWKRWAFYKFRHFAFGISAAIYNDTVAIGDTSCTNTIYDCAVYIYTRDESEKWVEQQTLIPQNKTLYQKFGDVITMDSRFLFIVGYEKSSKQLKRTVFVYKRKLDFYQTVKYVLHQLLPESSEIYDQSLLNTTSSLSVNGNYLVVGTAALAHDGSVYIYTYDSLADTWIKRERMLPSKKVKCIEIT